MVLEVDDVRALLLEQGQPDAAALLAEAEFDYTYIDTAMRMDTEFGDIDIYELAIRVPFRIYSDLDQRYSDAAAAASRAVSDLSESTNGLWIRSTCWQLRPPRIEDVEPLAEVTVLSADARLSDINRLWTKAKGRTRDDPDGAITAAKTILESLCKKLVDLFGGSYTNRDDLPALYRNAATLLNLAPGEQTEKEYKKATGAVMAIVDSISCIRNREGDSHSPVHTASRLHARLVVNLAGSVASFLAELLVAQSENLGDGD